MDTPGWAIGRGVQRPALRSRMSVPLRVARRTWSDIGEAYRDPTRANKPDPIQRPDFGPRFTLRHRMSTVFAHYLVFAAMLVASLSILFLTHRLNRTRRALEKTNRQLRERDEE